MNTMTKKDWEDVDKKSRELIIKFFEYTKCKVEQKIGNCCIDLIVTSPKGTKFGIEIKDRSFPSTKFGDVFAESIKKKCAQKRIEKGEIDKALAINVFTDNVIAIANLFDKNAKTKFLSCPATSLVKGGLKTFIKKECLSLPQTIKIKFDNNGNFKRV